MSLRYQRKVDRFKFVDNLTNLLQELTFHGISPQVQRDTMTHMEWLRQQRGLDITCTMETIPELGLTKISIGIVPTPPEASEEPSAKPH